jgi:hypothetical protein
MAGQLPVDGLPCTTSPGQIAWSGTLNQQKKVTRTQTVPIKSAVFRQTRKAAARRMKKTVCILHCMLRCFCDSDFGISQVTYEVFHTPFKDNSKKMESALFIQMLDHFEKLLKGVGLFGKVIFCVLSSFLL